jgi:hypothetical protein
MKYCKNEFLRFEDILAIDPGYSFTNGAGWALFSDGRLKHCGLVAPFAAGLDSKQSCLEVLEKLSTQWEALRGFHIKPELLCLESPIVYPRYSQKIDTRSLDNIHFLNGMLSERFNPRELLTPTPYQWKQNKPKDVHREEIIAALDQNSQNVLAETLKEIPGSKWHNVIDAVGLGLYASTIHHDAKPEKRALAA